MSGTIDKIKAKVDNVLHKDKHNDPTTGTHTTGTHTGTGVTGSHGTTGVHGNDPTGPHSSHAANKADPRVDSDRYGAAGNTSGAGGVGAGQYSSGTTHGTTGSGLTGSHGTTGGLGSSYNDPTGPHSSHAANQADPRVDSDRYGSAGNTSGAGGVGAGQYGSSTTHGTTGTHSQGGGLGQKTATSAGDPHGPHSSKLANKLDPTVDTKTYGTAHDHGTSQYTTGGTHGTHGTTGSGLTGGTHGTHGTTGSGLTGGTHGTTGYSDPSGPHDSKLGNKADPRVDSDRYGAAGNTSGAGGYGAGQYTGSSNTSSGLTGSHGTHTGTTGSGLTGSHGTHGTTGAGYGGTVGSGNSSNTAGPHNSDLLNKVDPRVDSDLDGSKTVGGNQTYR